MKTFFVTFCLWLIAGACLADGPVVQTTPLTRQFLRSPDAGTARSVIGVFATNNWPVTNVTLQTPTLNAQTANGGNFSNPTNTGGSYTGGFFSGMTNVSGSLTNPIVTGGQTSGLTNNNQVSNGGSFQGSQISNSTNYVSLVGRTFTNSPLMSLAATAISEGFLRSANPLPPIGWDSYGQYGAGIDINGISNFVVRLNNSVLSRFGKRFIVCLDDGWEATNLDGTAWDSQGILLANTNKFPGAIPATSALAETNGYSFGLFLQNSSTFSDSGSPYHGILSNTYGNFQYYITNANVDYFRGHGDWNSSPQKSFDQMIEAGLACAGSGLPVAYAAQDPWPDNTKGTHFFKTWLPWMNKFFPVISQKSGSGFPDFAGDLPAWRNLFNFSFTNFASSVSPGHCWEDLAWNFNPTTLYDTLWHYDKVCASVACMTSAGIIQNNIYPDVALYQTAFWPVDPIMTVDQDPLMRLPDFAAGNYSSSTNILVKQMQQGTWAICAVNWDTNSATTITYSPGSFLPTNCAGWIVHDLWGWTNSPATPDYFLPVNGSITNALQAPDCSLYKFTPVTQQKVFNATNQWNFVSPLYYGLIFDMPLNEGQGSTSVGDYASMAFETNYLGQTSVQTPTVFGTIEGSATWQAGNVGNSIATTNLSITSPNSADGTNYIQFPASALPYSFSQFSFEATFKEASFTSNYAFIFETEQQGTGVGMTFGVNGSNGGIMVQLNTAAFNQAFDVGPGTDGNWHDFCVTYNGATVTTYIDGVSQNATAFTQSVTNYPGGLIYVDMMHSGSVGAVRLWNRALSANEVKLLYRQSFPP